MIYNIKNGKREKGFTLVEMLVSVTVFSIIMIIISNAIASGIHSQKYILSRQEILDELNYAIERTSRAVVMARKDDLSVPLVSCLVGNKVNYETDAGGTYIKFKDYNGECRHYYVIAGVLKETIGVDTADLTSSNLSITNFKVILDGQTQADNKQPRVTILIEATSAEINNSSTIRLQTTVSQRNPDITIN